MNCFLTCPPSSYLPPIAPHLPPGESQLRSGQLEEAAQSFEQELAGILKPRSSYSAAPAAAQVTDPNDGLAAATVSTAAAAEPQEEEKVAMQLSALQRAKCAQLHRRLARSVSNIV